MCIFFPHLLKLCLLLSHVLKKQLIPAFKTLSQKGVGFLDKVTGRKDPGKLLLLPSHFTFTQAAPCCACISERCMDVASSIGLWRTQGASGKRMVVMNAHLLLGPEGFLQEVRSRWWKQAIRSSDSSKRSVRSPAADGELWFSQVFMYFVNVSFSCTKYAVSFLKATSFSC